MDPRDAIGMMMSKKLTKSDITHRRVDRVRKAMVQHIPNENIQKAVSGYSTPADVKEDSYVEGQPKQGWHSHDYDEDADVMVDHVKGRKSGRKVRPATLGGHSPFDDRSPKEEAAQRAKKTPRQQPNKEMQVNQGKKYPDTATHNTSMNKSDSMEGVDGQGETISGDLLMAAVSKMGGRR